VLVRRADGVTVEPVTSEGAEGVTIQWLINEGDPGAEHFVMRRFEVVPGGHTPLHTHPWEHEVYVLAGRGVVATPDGDHAIAPGDVVLVAPRDVHQFRCTGDETLQFLCLIPAPESCG